MNAIVQFQVDIGEFDRIVVDGSVECRLLKQTATELLVYSVEDRNYIRQFDLNAIEGLINKPHKFRFDRDYYTLEKIEQRAKSSPTLAELHSVAAAGLNHRYTLVMEWRQALEKFPLNDPCREQLALDQVYFNVALRFARRDVRSTMSLKDKPLSLETLLKYDRRLRAFGDDPAALVDGRHKGSGNRLPRFNEVEERLIDWAVDEYLQPTKPTIKLCWNRLKDEVDRRNRERDPGRIEALKCPGYETFKRRIQKISGFIKHATRLGLKSAEKEFRASYGGQDYARPGQRMEVDGWVCHLHTLVENSSLWPHLPREVRARLQKVRVTFVVVIDVATNSILGIHFSWSESAAAITAALRMAMEDKSSLANAFGCKSSWSQYGWGNWVHDRAGVYDEEELTEKILKSLTGKQSSVPGVPWLRPTIESFFKTISNDLLIHFTGQTGSNFNNRTDFQTADNASITVDELVEKTIQWIVDKYHHTRIDSLGMTPIAAWHKLCQLAPPPPRHGPAKMIEIFGKRQIRPIRITGVSLAASQFQSPALQRLRRLLGTPKVETWIDHENLGQILVKVPEHLREKVPSIDGWLIVPGPRELQGISLRHINLADDDLALRFGYDQVTSEMRASEMRTSLAASGKDAARQRLTENPPSLAQIEKQLARSYHYALGDDDFRAERAALHSPIAIAGGGVPVHLEDEGEVEAEITISLEDEA